MEIKSEVKFGDEKLKKAFKELTEGKFEDKQLKTWLENAFRDIEKNAFCCNQVPKKLIPREYQVRYGQIDNLWKYNLPNAWRLLYTIKRDKVIVLSIILEWMTHKEYERKFKY